MDIFIVIRVGVYRHEIGGVFTTLKGATDEAKRLLLSEPDRYHSYEVILQQLDMSAWDGDPKGDLGGFKDGNLLCKFTWLAVGPRSVCSRPPQANEIVMVRGGDATR